MKFNCPNFVYLLGLQKSFYTNIIKKLLQNDEENISSFLNSSYCYLWGREATSKKGYLASYGNS